MKTPIYKGLLVILTCGFFIQAGCMQKQVRLDLDTYMLKADGYVDQDIIITATLADVLARYDQYRGKKIEMTAPVSYYSSIGFWTWFLMLEEGGKKLRCYTHYYRIEPGWDAINLLDRAIHGKKAVTVLGILKKDGLDIQRLTCDGEIAITSFKPPRGGLGLWPYYY